MAKSQRLDATITIGSVLKGAVGRNLKTISGGLKKVGDEIRTVADRQRELSKQRKVLVKEGRSVEALDREYQDLGRTLETLAAKQKRQNRAREAGNRAGASFRNMTGEIGRVARSAAIGVGLLGAAMVGVTTKVASNTEETNRWAKRLGVSTEFLSQMEFAAGKFGVKNDALIDGMKELSLRADEFAVTGKGPAAEAFARIGISAREAGALATDTAALFAVVRDRMSDVKDVAARQRIADELFGGTGAEQMIELLSISRQEIEALGAEAVKAGAVVTGGQADMAREYTQSFNRLGKVLEGLTRTVANEMMPMLTDAFVELGDFLIANKDKAVELGRALAEGLKKAAPVVRDMATGVAGVATKIGEVIEKVAEMVGGWENFGIAVGAMFASKAILGVAAFATDVFSLGRAMWALSPALVAIGAALWANPVLLIGAAIAGAAVLIYRNWGEIKDFLAPIFDWIGEKLKWLYDNSTLIRAVAAGAGMVGPIGMVAAALGGVAGASSAAAVPQMSTAAAMSSPYATPSAVLSRPPAAAAAPVAINEGPTTINIDAANMTPDEVMNELERRLAGGRTRNLYDGGGEYE
jgi:hypothetical protein